MASLSALSWIAEDILVLGPDTLGKLRAIEYDQTGRYLALGFARTVQVWDLQNLDQRAPSCLVQWSSLTDLTTLKWIYGDVLTTAHKDGRIYCISIQELRGARGSDDTVAINSQSNHCPSEVIVRGVKEPGHSGEASSLLFWASFNVLLAAIGDAVQMWKVDLSNLNRPWVFLGKLPDPPIIGGIPVKNLPISAIFVGFNDNIVVSYAEIGIVVWEVNAVSPSQSSPAYVNRMSGTVYVLAHQGPPISRLTGS
ncbi:hypothetical protein AAF712_010891 [Marasmius tenuissimus]|uniref:Uncharacterized protein n=1 Tax=Marasmius tenuissimus TaxID=585030 RepID=A0ABR2ZLY5_9AGAR